MTKQFYRYTVIFLLTCFSISVTATAQTVNIPDPNLRAAIERALGKASGNTITTVDMANLTRLVAPNADISDLAGLEGATNLTALDLGTEQVQQRVWRNNNSITDISVLQGLTKLEVLDLERNSITDISTVAGLTNLTELYLRNNLISDISPLAGLNKLTRLHLDFNGISNISSLTGLTNLEILTLTYNNISDISPLAGLNQLVLLGLTHNSISDLSPLVANGGLGSGNFVVVSVNPLNFASINIHIPDLQRRGVTVESDAVKAEPVDIPDPNLRAAIERGLGVASGTAITTADMENLTLLSALNRNISNLTGLEGAINMTALSLIDNSISDISPLEGLDSLIDLHLRRNSISDISALEGLDNLIDLGLSGNSISDILPLEGLNNLTQLGLEGNSISDISPLKGLNNLTHLSLSGNSISDISPLEGLNNLTHLSLSGNSISDLSPLVANTGLGTGDQVFLEGNPLNNTSVNTHIPVLQSRGVTIEFNDIGYIPDPNLRAKIEETLGKASGDTITTADMETLTTLNARKQNITNLTGLEGAINLTLLNLIDNSISDISPLEGLNNLIDLWLEGNSISDISPLEGLNNLIDLRLSGNSISDISPLEGLHNLTYLSLSGNSISDISPLEGLHNLTYLHLSGNSISDVSPLEGLNILTGLFLSDNSISDLSPLVANRGLGTGYQVFLEGNPLNNTSVNTHIPVLQSRGVTVEFDATVDIPDPNLRAAIENELGVASGDTIRPGDMETLTELIATHKNIRNLTGLEYATKLQVLDLRDNSISDISPLAKLTNLTTLRFARNNITDISPVARLTNLTELNFRSNSVSDIAPVTRLTNLTSLWLNGNSISDISPLAKLTRLTELRLDDNSISDISPLVANTGLGNGDEVNLKKNPLSDQALNTHIPTLQSRGVKVLFDDLKPTTSEYTLSIPAGISLIHVPLRVTAVNGREQPIESISDLYDALGGASTVTFLITHDPRDQEWYSYFGPSGTGTFADRRLTDDMGIIVGLAAPVSVHLRGTALGTNGNSTITLNQGLNVVGLPLNDSRIMRVSDLFTLDGIGGNVPAIILTDGGEFQLIGRPGDPGDIAITGGQAFIMVVQNATTITISGDAWAND